MTYSSSRRGADEFARADQDTIRLLKEKQNGSSEPPPQDEIDLDEQPKTARIAQSKDAHRT